MGKFSDLSIFGVNVDIANHLFDEESDTEKQEKNRQNEKKELTPQEQEMELIHDRKITCKICGHVFTVKALRNSRIRRAPSDADLRPRAEKIDILKYEAISCPYCGYSAMQRYYDRLSNYQMKLIREGITQTFEPQMIYDAPIYSYDYALQCYKMGLANAVVKKAKASEKAHYCLNIAWLLREKAKQLSPGAEYDEIKEAEEQFYRQAYDGLLHAMQEEMFPICGMDQNTTEYMIGYMAAYFKEYTVASKLISSVVTNKSTPNRLKDRALDLKYAMIESIKNGG